MTVFYSLAAAASGGFPPLLAEARPASHPPTGKEHIVSDRARNSLHQRGVDRDDLSSLIEFIVANGGHTEIKTIVSPTYTPFQHVSVSLAGHSTGGYLHHFPRGDFRRRLTATLDDLLVKLWDRVLADADRHATEAQVDKVLA